MQGDTYFNRKIKCKRHAGYKHIYASAIMCATDGTRLATANHMSLVCGGSSSSSANMCVMLLLYIYTRIDSWLMLLFNGILLNYLK